MFYLCLLSSVALGLRFVRHAHTHATLTETAMPRTYANGQRRPSTLRSSCRRPASGSLMGRTVASARLAEAGTHVFLLPVSGCIAMQSKMQVHAVTLLYGARKEKLVMDAELFSVRFALHLQSILSMLRVIKHEDLMQQTGRITQFLIYRRMCCFVLGMFCCRMPLSGTDSPFLNVRVWRKDNIGACVRRPLQIAAVAVQVFRWTVASQSISFPLLGTGDSRRAAR